MNKLTQTLLIGSALCALMTAPALAQPKHPAMHVTSYMLAVRSPG